MSTFAPRFRDSTVNQFLGYRQDAQTAARFSPMSPQSQLAATAPSWAGYNLLNPMSGADSQTLLNQWLGYTPPGSRQQHPGQATGNFSQGLSYGNGINPNGAFWRQTRAGTNSYSQLPKNPNSVEGQAYGALQPQGPVSAGSNRRRRTPYASYSSGY